LLDGAARRSRSIRLRAEPHLSTKVRVFVDWVAELFARSDVICAAAACRKGRRCRHRRRRDAAAREGSAAAAELVIAMVVRIVKLAARALPTKAFASHRAAAAARRAESALASQDWYTCGTRPAPSVETMKLGRAAEDAAAWRAFREEISERDEHTRGEPHARSAGAFAPIELLGRLLFDDERLATAPLLRALGERGAQFG